MDTPVLLDISIPHKQSYQQKRFKLSKLLFLKTQTLRSVCHLLLYIIAK